jgi:hypothetical protein
MRLLLFMFAICIGILCIGDRAEAQNYPWCAEYAGTPDGPVNCGFVTFDAWPLSGVSAVSAFEIIHIKRRPARTRRLEFKGTIPIKVPSAAALAVSLRWPRSAANCLFGIP